MTTAIGLRWPPDDDSSHDESGAQISLQSGQSGEDAALFTAEMLRMYAGYAERHSWPVSVDTLRASADGMMLSLTLRIASFGAYGWLKYEHGTHRVQRVPIDGGEGRIHTHTVKVIVRPLPLSPDSELLLAGSAEKIRTYHFPQDRVTDHRIDLSLHGLHAILSGDLDCIISVLRGPLG